MLSGGGSEVVLFVGFSVSVRPHAMTTACDRSLYLVTCCARVLCFMCACEYSLRESERHSAVESFKNGRKSDYSVWLVG